MIKLNDFVADGKGVLVLLFVFGVLTGCQREKRPDNFPPLVPCVLTVTQEGKPVSDVNIRLVAKDSQCPWAVSGRTDSHGVARLVTHGKFQGVPKGNFIAVLSKKEIEGMKEITSGDENAGPPPQGKIFSLIDLKYTKQTTSPLEIKVETKVQMNLELGPPVRVQTGSTSDA